MINPENCDHIRKKNVSDTTKECVDCGARFCTHPSINHDSTCLTCGEFITEISIEQTWCEAGYNKGTACNFIKSTKDHAKYLETLGYTSDVIESVMDKFSKVGCSLSEEAAVVAVCAWLTCWDLGCPRTMIEVAKKHSLTKSKIKKGRRIVLAFDYFKEYRTKYITISSMIRKLVDDLKIEEFVSSEGVKKYDNASKDAGASHFSNIYKLAKFVEENWEKLKTTKRSAPQNIASACVYVYLLNSPSLEEMIDTPTKKKEVCRVMGPSAITVDKLAKQIIDELIIIKK